MKTSKATPEGLADLVRRIMANRIGPDRALRRADILQLIKQAPIFRATNDRQLRGALEDLRDAGELICNLAEGDGYYIAGSLAEYQEFRRMYISYAATIERRARAMDQAAERRWKTSPLQGSLF